MNGASLSVPTFGKRTLRSRDHRAVANPCTRGIVRMGRSKNDNCTASSEKDKSGYFEEGHDEDEKIVGSNK